MEWAIHQGVQGETVGKDLARDGWGRANTGHNLSAFDPEGR
jgi:hypothetical protein